ncbi:MAG: 6-carboxytetrahydropterin synthase [Candidatus Shapirobacteria bacterium]
MIVVKQIEWDMGHRVMNHNSKCKNIHGHRYKMEVALEGNLIGNEGDSSEGMVIDFGDIKKIAMEYVHDVLDHGFMVWEKDEKLLKFFAENPDQKHIVVPFTSTAENIAKWVFDQLNTKYTDSYKTGLRLKFIRLWETPTGYVICNQDEQ